MTEPIILALIAAAVPIVMNLLLWLREILSPNGLHAKINHITFLTNSKFSEALERIKELEAEVLKNRR